ncbi:hypothetical protein [Flavobacterium selenitireducens]|uniref:hypothetical protein n=1 Tax=Flavobacterium selenitireducens TaxID=2722704 RepID=UPI00168B67DA|nr:hypothetical protein [Flavobacterium selenitireducens]MBD3580894.1 hypothetical protein [Flavobacterium selenitireducens]
MNPPNLVVKSDPFLPGNLYLIRNTGNNFEDIFIEDRNYPYFLDLFHRHVGQIAYLLSFRLFRNGFELLIELKNISDIPEKYRQKLYLPFSNFFNAYTKSINKAYGRSGSLFREHFSRTKVNRIQAANLKTGMEYNAFHPKNLSF